MASWAKPGIKCVKFRFGEAPNRPNGVYYNGMHPLHVPVTIKRVVQHPRGHICFVIQEYPNWCPVYNMDVGWYAANFRPLIAKTQEQDIEMFLRIANDTPFHVMVDEELYPID